jgi:hypothetical protein
MNLPLFPRRLQLPIPLGLNLLLMPGEHVCGELLISPESAIRHTHVHFGYSYPLKGNFFRRPSHKR